MITLPYTFASARVPYRSRREEGGQVHEHKQEHTSVMVKEVLTALQPKDGDVVVDATFGMGGHSRALKAAAKIQLIALDADPAAGEGVIEANFAGLDKVLKKLGIEKVDKVLFDLGWNATQLQSGRGFSFLRDEPLLMSYGTTPSSGFTAAEIVNEWDETVLADVFFGYGEERYARRIAKAIIVRRNIQPIKTTFELVEIVRDATPAMYHRGRLHFATKTFQALRIAVNDELGVLERGLVAAWNNLSCHGRIAVVTFHSTEDRAVKKMFAAYSKADGRLLYKKPLTPSRVEALTNPRSRSAKLRVIEKIC